MTAIQWSPQVTTAQMSFSDDEFMENSTDNTDEEEFAEQVDSLRHSGNWNTCIADVTPLDIANIFRRYVRIYSSNITNPVCDVIPDQCVMLYLTSV